MQQPLGRGVQTPDAHTLLNSDHVKSIVQNKLRMTDSDSDNILNGMLTDNSTAKALPAFAQEATSGVPFTNF